MYRFFNYWSVPSIVFRFTPATGHSFDGLTDTSCQWSDRRIGRLMQLVPWDFLAEDTQPKKKPVLPTPTDVPVPEPFDVPVPEPWDVPPPDPHDVPPPKEPQEPEFDPKPRPIP